jgi:hypothetical protein
MHITATMAATEDESAPPARRGGSKIDVISWVAYVAKIAGKGDKDSGFRRCAQIYMISYRSAIKYRMSLSTFVLVFFFVTAMATAIRGQRGGMRRMDREN